MSCPRTLIAFVALHLVSISMCAGELRTKTLDSGKPGPVVLVIASEGGAGSCGLDALHQLQHRLPSKGAVVLVEALTEFSTRAMVSGWSQTDSLVEISQRHPEHYRMFFHEAFDAWSYTEGAEGDQVEGEGDVAEAVLKALKSMTPLTKGQEWGLKREWRLRQSDGGPREIKVTANAKFNAEIGFRPAQRQREFRYAARGLLQHLGMTKGWTGDPALFPRERSSQVRVAVFDDGGALSSTGHGPHWLRSVLALQKDLLVELVGTEELRRGVLAHADVLVIGGGQATPQAAALGEDGREVIRDFVRSGGGFLGICAGACMASLPTESWKHIGLLPVRIEATNASCTIPLAWNAHPLGPAKMENADLSGGPRLVIPPESAPHIKVWATFQGEIKNNKTGKVESLKDTPAVLSGNFGKGRVLIFSTHCERRPSPSTFFPGAVRWCGTPEKMD